MAPSSSVAAAARGVVGSAGADELDAAAASRDLNGTLSRSTVSAGGDGGGDPAAPATPLRAGAGPSAKVLVRPGDRGESMALAAAASRSLIGTESSSTPRVCDSDLCRCCTCTTLRTARRIATWASHAITMRPPREMPMPTWAVHHGSVRIPLPIIVLIMFAVARPGDDASSAAMAGARRRHVGFDRLPSARAETCHVSEKPSATSAMMIAAGRLLARLARPSAALRHASGVTGGTVRIGSVVVPHKAASATHLVPRAVCPRLAPEAGEALEVLQWLMKKQLLRQVGAVRIAGCLDGAVGSRVSLLLFSIRALSSASGRDASRLARADLTRRGIPILRAHRPRGTAT